ncbi:Tat (twin-arginine translocation) pathway signal sequence [Haladaptatus litoreus]|uniref:Tat (Twin-arginine translocation) pathway signal sequence n=1 Tax=Haladaptatus litoreus TaxID=553468 RepID=A0A1N7DK87_9EURY|nr:PQQ-binding-like beta-propeller repeat protein [Haladaptatus litoreus]SIR76279.1 Tat (twin-arginine translocation) pathway signal sequence [Haladaptatus litoreus]
MQEDNQPDGHQNSRRTFLKTVGITVGAAGLETTTVAAKDDDSSTDKATNWITARSNPRRTGAVSGTGPTPYTATNWKMDLDGSMHSKEPVVKDGTVYLAVTTNNGSADSDGYIGAYDTETGEQQWKQSDLPTPKTPTIGEQMLYFSTQVSETNEENRGGLYAIDSESGDIVWSRTDSLKWTSPIAIDQRIYTSNVDGAYALDSMTGETIWKTDDIGMLTDGSDGALSYANGTVFFSDGTALDAARGRVQWRVTDADSAFGNHVVANGRVYYLRTKYIEDDDDVIRVEARSVNSGRIDWAYDIGTSNVMERRFAVANGYVLFYEPGSDNTITALNAKTGAHVWTKELVGDYFSNLTIANKTVYLGGRYMDPANPGTVRAAIHALDITTGERKWSQLLDESDLETSSEGLLAAGTPAVGDGKIYATTYPAGSVFDYHYLQYSNFFVLESSNSVPDGERTIAAQSD